MKKILFRPRAARDLEQLPNHDRGQVEEAIERFAQSGFGDVKMLAGEGRQFRLRVRDWRVRFVYEKPDIVRILHIRHRREAYRWKRGRKTPPGRPPYFIACSFLRTAGASFDSGDNSRYLV